MRYGLCCICLDLQENYDPPIKFNTMTYQRFSTLDRADALEILGNRILNNLYTTFHNIEYCASNNYCYRISSSLFPLITYDAANVKLEDLPNYDDIILEFAELKRLIKTSGVRISCHPSEFNVLASTNQIAVDKTIVELNFYSFFLDQIGCDATHNAPMNIHIHNNTGTHKEIIDRFMYNFDRLDQNCQKRLVIENDDKLNCWSVKQLFEHFHNRTQIPITFDYLHHKCHPDGLSEQEALTMCHKSWDNHTPLFHYSESRPGNNPRAHADYTNNIFNTYDLDFDIDFELKMKDKAIAKYKADLLCVTN